MFHSLGTYVVGPEGRRRESVSGIVTTFVPCQGIVEAMEPALVFDGMDKTSESSRPALAVRMSRITICHLEESSEAPRRLKCFVSLKGLGMLTMCGRHRHRLTAWKDLLGLLRPQITSTSALVEIRRKMFAHRS